jgi:hypothetical protein
VVANYAQASAGDIAVTDAKIAGGMLVVTGTTAKAHTKLTLDGQFNATSNAAKTFSFNLVYLPAGCIVELTDAASAGTPTQAVIADCGPHGVNPMGAWSAATNYATDDLVTSLGSSWRAMKDNVNKSPSANPASWEKFAAKGDTGATGQAGASGPQGPAGAAGPRKARPGQLARKARLAHWARRAQPG